MFIIGINKSDLGRLNGSGLQVKINGQTRLLRRKGQLLSWTDETVLQEKKIVNAVDHGTLVEFHCANDATNSDGCVVLRPELVGGRVVMKELR